MPDASLCDTMRTFGRTTRSSVASLRAPFASVTETVRRTTQGTRGEPKIVPVDESKPTPKGKPLTGAYAYGGAPPLTPSTLASAAEYGVRTSAGGTAGVAVKVIPGITVIARVFDAVLVPL